MPEHLTDDELEQAFRDGLRRAAAGAPAELRDGIPRVAGSATAPSRRRAIWVAAAAAAVVAVGVPLVLQRGDRAPAPIPGDMTVGSTTSRPAPSTRPSVVPGTGWRTESYAGLELQVPSTWGWGGTPVSPGSGEAGVCAVHGATVAPDGSRDSNAAMDLPFVGRPVLQSDACRLVEPDDARPDVDAVWFDSPLPLGSGNASRTVTVGGRRVTVFTGSAPIRDRILGSITDVSATHISGCSTTEMTLPAAALPHPADPSGLVVCAYGSRTTEGGRELLWSATRSADAAREYVELARNDRLTSTACDAEAQEIVYVGISDRDQVVWDQIVLGACSEVHRSDGRTVQVSPQNVRPWSGPESMAYLVGPSPHAAELTEDLLSLFRGVLG